MISPPKSSIKEPTLWAMKYPMAPFFCASRPRAHGRKAIKLSSRPSQAIGNAVAPRTTRVPKKRPVSILLPRPSRPFSAGRRSSTRKRYRPPEPRQKMSPERPHKASEG